MTTVDNRIVHMTFDNAQFERNIAQTMDSMAKMKQSLDFSGAKNTFAGITDSASKVNLGGIASAVDNISSKFTAMGAIAFSTIEHITSRAIDAGVNLAKSFTVSPILDGFHEMETNMNAIQTILANTDSKGTTLDQVNVALDKLNTYSDETIYNFSQMAKNIGTFTAAGIDLDTSVNSIKGIANLAAISGSNADQASTAMYQLSQALASGSVKLMDWNSVVNAGMGGEVFQKALFETGKSLGTIADVPMGETFDEWKKAGNTFRSSLESGWVTSQVLTNTLSAFTGDLTDAQLKSLGYNDQQIAEMQRLGKTGKAAATEVKTLTQLLGTVKEAVGSGWTRSFQIVFGNFEEAKTLFTDLNNVIGAFVSSQANKRNELLQGWKDLGGRAVLIEGLKNAFKGLASIIAPITKAFHEIFPPATAKTLFALTEKFAEFTKRISISGYTALQLQVIFEGVFNAIKIAIEVVRQAAAFFHELYDSLVPNDSAHGVLQFFEDIGVKISELKGYLVDDGGIKKFFDNLLKFVQDPVPIIDGFITWIKGAFQEIINIFLFKDFTGKGPWEEDSPIVVGFFKLRDKIGDILGSIGDTISGFFGKIGDKLGVDIHIPQGLIDFFKSFSDNVDANTTNSLAGGFDRLSGALSGLWDVLKKVWDVLGKILDAVQWAWDKFMGFGDEIGKVFSAIFDFAKNIGPNLQKAFMSDEFDKFLQFLQTVALLLGGGGLANISKNGLKVDVTGGSLSNLGQFFKQLQGTIPGIKQNLSELTNTLQDMQLKLKAEALQKIAVAIGILTASVLVLSLINPESLAKALAALSVGFGQLVGAFAILNKVGDGPKDSANMAALAGGLILMSTAVLILSGALALLAQLSWEQIGKGLSAVAALMAIMIGSAKLLEGSSLSLAAAGVGMIAIATALTILGGALAIFATMSWEELGKGMAAVAAGLLIIAGAMQLMPADTILIGPGLVAVSIALNGLATAMLLFATMSWQDIGKGLAAVGAGLLIIAGAMQLMPLTTVLNGPGLIAVATALTILGGALKIFATMSWEEIGKAMTVLGSSLLILGLGLTLMEGTIAGSIALGIAAASFLLFSNVLKTFAAMKWKDIGKGLAAMAVVIGAIALMAVVVSPAIELIFALGLALSALGVAFVLFGVGAGLLAEAFQIIAAAGTAGIDVLMYAIDQLTQRLPEMATQFAQSLIDFAQMILDAAPALITGIGKVLAALIDQVILLTPKIAEAATGYILAFLKVIRDSSPDFIATGLQLITDLLHGILDNIVDITTTVATIIAKFIDALANKTPDLVAAGLALLTAFIQGIADNIQDIIDAGANLLVNFLEGIAANIGDVVDAAIDVLTAYVDAIADNIDDVVKSGVNLVLKFIEGIGNGLILITFKATDLIIHFIEALGNNGVRLANAGFDVVIKFLNGMADAIESHRTDLYKAGLNIALAVADGFTFGLASKGINIIKKTGGLFGSVVDAAKAATGSHSPSTKFYALAGDVIAGFVNGLNDDTSAERTMTNFGTNVSKTFQKALSQIPENVGNMTEFQPTITPVLDLTDVRNTAGQLSGLLNGNTITAQVSADQANLIAAGTTASQADAANSQNESKVTKIDKVFEQNIYSPKPLNAATIYRQSKSQIELAKKELDLVS